MHMQTRGNIPAIRPPRGACAQSEGKPGGKQILDPSLVNILGDTVRKAASHSRLWAAECCVPINGELGRRFQGLSP